MSLVEVLKDRVAALERRRAELESAVADPERVGRAGFTAMLRELGSLQKTLEPWRLYVRLDGELRSAREMAAGDDAEMAALAREEVARLESRLQEQEGLILERVLEGDQDGDRPALVEVRAGTGGDEAALFAGDLFRIYGRFAESRGWTLEVQDSSPGDAGGFKEIIFKLGGAGAYRTMRFETGGHRVQRIPATESQGRIHTSAATVAILPEVEELDFELDPDDLEITAMRSSGPGGQHVNKTSSAIRVTHKPTGFQVRCQEGKSQHQNRLRALSLLRARLYEMERSRREVERSDLRRSQVGSGDRSQRIRTYNWPQNRVTDHRINLSFSLEQVLEGRLDDLIQALQKADREAKLAAL